MSGRAHQGTVFQPLGEGDPRHVAGYRLAARLGAGGMGKVYLSYTPGGRPVAIKVIRPDFGQDAEFRRRFAQEVHAAQRVQGLYTAPVIDSDPDAEQPWLATAYVPGPSLADAVAQHGKLPVETVLLLVAGIAEALQVIHGAGIVHRDLKPANVLLAADGPRVIDFGIARAADATSLTSSGVTIGTPSFMAPEQAAGSQVTPATDIFALGQVAAYAATGRAAFGEGTSHGVLYRIVHEEPDLSGVPEALHELVTRCLAKEPDERPSVAELLTICQSANAETVLRRPEEWLPSVVAAEIGTRKAAPAPPVTPAPPAAPAPGHVPAPPATPPLPAAGPQVPAPPVGAPAAGPAGPPGGAPAPVEPPPSAAPQASPEAGSPAAATGPEQAAGTPQDAASGTPGDPRAVTATPTAVSAPATPPPGFGPPPASAYGYPHPQPVPQGATVPTPQYGAPAQPYGAATAPAGPTPPPKKRGRFIAIAIAATLVVGALAGGGAYLALSDKDDKGETGSSKPGDAVAASEAPRQPVDSTPESGPTPDPSVSEQPSQPAEPVQDPEPSSYTGLNVVDGYHLTFGDDPLKPLDDNSNSDVSYDWSLGRLDVENGRLILLRNGQKPDLATCRGETRYAQNLELDVLSKGSKFCVLTDSGHVGVVTYQGKSPDSDPSKFVTLDVTVWLNAVDVVQPTS
ncbi:protein kinase [Streptomyces sp. NPDC004609]|uniref:serine/threonine-protein kinase n=1 Tax=Streptomyces sp. NPDC004609 TaxID=3364704 RepID=UPI0036A53DD4